MTSSTSIPDERNSNDNSGRWRLLYRLGEGGLARVYRVADATGPLGEVALKVLKTNARAVHAFELHREAQWSLTRLHNPARAHYDPAGARLFARYLSDHTGFAEPWPHSTKHCRGGGAHPDFDRRRQSVEMPDFDWKDVEYLRPQVPYVILEALGGISLHAAMQADNASFEGIDGGRQQIPGSLSWRSRNQVLEQLVRASGYLNAAGIIHRDFRPCNVQLYRRTSERCDLKVLDLGVAIAAEDQHRQNRNVSIYVYEPERVATGGFDWLPWEVRDGVLNFDWPSHSFDIFSFGVMWLQLAIGRRCAADLLKELAYGVGWHQVSPQVARSGLFDVQTKGSIPTLGRILGRCSDRPAPLEVLRQCFRSDGPAGPRTRQQQRFDVHPQQDTPTRSRLRNRPARGGEANHFLRPSVTAPVQLPQNAGEVKRQRPTDANLTDVRKSETDGCAHLDSPPVQVLKQLGNIHIAEQQPPGLIEHETPPKQPHIQPQLAQRQSYEVSNGQGESVHLTEPACGHSRSIKDDKTSSTSHNWHAAVQQKLGREFEGGHDDICDQEQLCDLAETENNLEKMASDLESLIGQLGCDSSLPSPVRKRMRNQSEELLRSVKACSSSVLGLQRRENEPNDDGENAIEVA